MFSFNKVINSWKQKIRKYFFSYRNGFYELYMIANSPQLLIHNIVNMPFVKHDEQLHKITTQNPFLRVKIFYLPLEEGLFLMLSEAFYKKNVMDHIMYDKEQPTIHFFISLKVSRINIESKSPLLNGTCSSSSMWSLCKPAGIKNLCYFKNSNEHFYTLYYTQAWLEEYLKHANNKVKDFFMGFLKSETTFMLLPRHLNNVEHDFSLFNATLEDSKPVVEMDKEALRKLSLHLFDDFISSIDLVNFNAEYFNMSNELRLKVLSAENYLSKFYNEEFPGLEEVAHKVGISVTGLKTGFKQIYGCSIYSYFRNQKMKIALAILESNKEIKIKNLAAQMGYDNAAKFAAAFKEEVGFFPSELTENK